MGAGRSRMCQLRVGDDGGRFSFPSGFLFPRHTSPQRPCCGQPQRPEVADGGRRCQNGVGDGVRGGTRSMPPSADIHSCPPPPHPRLNVGSGGRPSPPSPATPPPKPPFHGSQRRLPAAAILSAPPPVTRHSMLTATAAVGRHSCLSHRLPCPTQGWQRRPPPADIPSGPRAQDHPLKAGSGGSRRPLYLPAPPFVTRHSMLTAAAAVSRHTSLLEVLDNPDEGCGDLVILLHIVKHLLPFVRVRAAAVGRLRRRGEGSVHRCTRSPLPLYADQPGRCHQPQLVDYLLAAADR